MAIDIPSRLFIFRPECSFSNPSTQCSSGWLLYVLVFLIAVVLFRSAVVALVAGIAFVIVSFTSSYGLPWYELLYHSGIGCLIGLLVLFACDGKAPQYFPKGFFDNLLGVFALLVDVFILLLTQGGLDVMIPETRSQYGLFVSFVLALVWLFISSMVIFCIRDMDNHPYAARHYYFRCWGIICIIFVIAYPVALLPHSNSYIKSFLLLCAVSVIAVILEQLLCPRKRAIE